MISRMISPLSGVNASRIRRKQLDPDELNKVKAAYDALEQLPLHIDDSFGVSLLWL